MIVVIPTAGQPRNPTGNQRGPRSVKRILNPRAVEFHYDSSAIRAVAIFLRIPLGDTSSDGQKRG